MAELARGEFVSSEKTKILVIDDCQLDRDVAAMMLQEEGFDVVAVPSGQNCVEIVRQEKPSLVLLDIMMPEWDGNDVLQALRKNFSQIELPVIMVTAKSDASDVVQALKSGANDYITKPVQFDVALRRVETQLTLAGQHKSLVRAQKLEAVNAMVVTYNHQINNALTVAMGMLEMLQDQCGENEKFVKTRSALLRVAGIVEKIRDVAESGQAEFVNYSEKSMMMEIEKK